MPERNKKCKKDCRVGVTVHSAGGSMALVSPGDTPNRYLINHFAWELGLTLSFLFIKAIPVFSVISYIHLNPEEKNSTKIYLSMFPNTSDF
jgi:hypothetical protein